MNTKIIDRLFQLKDNEYAEFHRKLIPTVDGARVIGVRVPTLRKLAKEMSGDGAREFLASLPHRYYEEDMLHGLLICNIKDYDDCIKEIERFLPHVDNWAVTDSMNPKVFAGNHDKLILEIRRWIKFKQTYVCRFGMLMLMKHYLDDGYSRQYLDLVAGVHSDEYYVKMMQAWFFATALINHQDDVLVYLKERRLDRWVHAKTIQKACESYRITGVEKNILRQLK